MEVNNCRFASSGSRSLVYGRRITILTSPSVPGAHEPRFVLALGVAQIASWGTLFYSFPLIAVAMGSDLGWTKASIYGAWTLGIVLSALLAMPVGKVIDLGYGRQVMGGASLAAAALLILWSSVDNLVLFYVAAAGVGTLQAATLYEPAFAVIARRTGPAFARKGITAVTLWGGFASTLFVPLIQVMMEVMGWRGTLHALAGINVLICATLYFGVIDPRRDAVIRLQPEDQVERPPLALALKTPVFWWLTVSFTAYAASASAFLLHVYPFLQEQGFGAAAIVATIALIGPAQVIGRLAVAFLAKEISGRRLGSVIVVAFPLAMVIFAWAPANVVVVGCASILFGAANGIMTIVRGIIVPEVVSKDAYGAINGALVVPATVARALAPLGAAALWSLTGNYSVAMLFLLGLTLVMAVAFWKAAAISHRKRTA